jgi:tellurite resistance protein
MSVQTPAAQAVSVPRSRASRAARARITPNLFGIPFGFAGLAGAWTAAGTELGIAGWPGDVLWCLTVAAWIAVAGLYLRDARSRMPTELADPTFAPFLSLALITPMLAGAALAPHWNGPGDLVAVVFLVATVVFGGWMTGTWIVEDMTLERWHPGYFLPTVAGGLLSSEVASAIGHPDLAALLFGFGVVSWVVLGSVLLVRLFTLPMVPAPLIPTIAIEVAPPVVAGSAWFALNGGRVDDVALGLAGYALLMVLVQLRLLPLYRTVPFGPGLWAFSFSYAAVFTAAIHWLSVGRTADARTWAAVLLAVLTAAFAVLVVRTAIAVARGTFLPRT